jgi:hypothetical protein
MKSLLFQTLSSSLNIKVRTIQNSTLTDRNNNKGRLVNAVVRHYVENNPDTTFGELKTKVSNSIQGSFLVSLTQK